MAAYADYLFYQNTYGGSLVPEGEFQSLAIRATALISRLTFGRALMTENVKLAVCAAVDSLYLPAGGVIASENNDGYSVTYESQSESEREGAAVHAAKAFLPPELTNRGCWG